MMMTTTRLRLPDQSRGVGAVGGKAAGKVGRQTQQRAPKLARLRRSTARCTGSVACDDYDSDDQRRRMINPGGGRGAFCRSPIQRLPYAVWRVTA
jgi:hypothetical protein